MREPLGPDLETPEPLGLDWASAFSADTAESHSTAYRPYHVQSRRARRQTCRQFLTVSQLKALCKYRGFSPPGADKAALAWFSAGSVDLRRLRASASSRRSRTRSSGPSQRQLFRRPAPSLPDPSGTE